MNYLVEINAFYDLQLLRRLSTGQIALWNALMTLNNKCAWIPWFSAANATLQLLTGLSRDGIYCARRQLESKGYIEIRHGGTEQAPFYHLISLAKVQQDGRKKPMDTPQFREKIKEWNEADRPLRPSFEQSLDE